VGDDVLKVRLTAEGIQEVMSALKKVRTETEKTGKAGKDAVDTLGALGTIFAAGQIAAFVKNSIEAADGLSKMAQKTGVAVEQLSVLTYMGQQADLSNQDLEKGLVKLAKSLTGLEQGAAADVEAFSRLGLTAEDFKGLSLDQALVKIANAQARFADGAGKADTMMVLLGKSGANMIPLMNDLANGGFENARKKLEDLGLVLSTDMAKASQDFNDSMKRLELAAQGATVQIAQGVLPGLTKGIDALTAALAGTPAGLKAFAGGFLVVGAASTAAAIAIRAVGTALVGLGPVGIAVVALSALAAGVMGLEAAQERSRQEDLRIIDSKGRMVQNSEALERAYRKEAAAVEKAGTNKKEAEKHSKKLKEIEDQLISMSPDIQKALKDETKDWREKAEAIKAAREQAQESLKLDKQKTEQAIADQEAALRATRRIQQDQARLAGGSKAAKAIPEITSKDVDSDLKIQELRARLSGINQALGLEKPAGKAGEGDKAALAAQDAARQKALAASSAAEAKRILDASKADLDGFSALAEELYRRGLIDLTTYEAARRTIIQASTANEIALLEAQIAAEEKGRTKGMTPAEKIASETKVADLQAQIRLKRQQGEEQLNALERKARDEREKASDAALKAEADLAQAKGRTGEAGIKAIEVEYDRRIQLAKTDKEREALKGLKGSAVAGARLGDVSKDLERGQAALSISLGNIDNERAMGAITEEEAIRRKIALYQEFIPILEQVAEQQQELADLTGNPDDLLKAAQNSQAVKALKGNLKELGDQINWVKTTAKDAFEENLTNFLMNIGDKTTSLIDKFKQLGRAIAEAVARQAAARAAAAITTYLFQADGGYISGPGTSTSDSIPAYLSNGEFVVKAAAVQRYGAGLFHALNGLQVPRFAQGGLVGAGTGEGARVAPLIGQINITVDAGSGKASVTGDGAGLQLAQRMRQEIVRVILDEKRPGGSLDGR